MTKEQFLEYTNFTEGDSFITIVIHRAAESIDVSQRSDGLNSIEILGYLSNAMAQTQKNI